MKYFIYRVIDFFKYPKYYFFSRIKSVFEWLPVVWKDRDFDYAYMQEMMYHKIKKMRKRFEKWYAKGNWIHVRMEDDIRYMKICEKLLKYCIDDHYENEVHDFLEKKYGKLDLIFEKSDKEGYNSIDFTRDGKEITEEQREEESKLYRLAWKKQEKANKLLHRILVENARGWWI